MKRWTVIVSTLLAVVMLVFSFGNLRPEHAMHSMNLFCERVMPRLKQAVARD